MHEEVAVITQKSQLKSLEYYKTVK